MNNLKFFSFLGILFISMMSISLVSCGGGDDDEDLSTETPTSETPTESTATLATEQVKTITLKPISEEERVSEKVNNGECLVYKDFYYKHTLCLYMWPDGVVLCVNSYTGNGGGWKHSSNIAVIKDIGPVSSIKEIVNKSHFEYRYLQYSFYDGKNYCNWYTLFKPGYGYEVAFYTGPSQEFKWLRVFPTNYTFDKNDVITSVTLEYQLY